MNRHEERCPNQKINETKTKKHPLIIQIDLYRSRRLIDFHNNRPKIDTHLKKGPFRSPDREFLAKIQ